MRAITRALRVRDDLSLSFDRPVRLVRKLLLLCVLVVLVLSILLMISGTVIAVFIEPSRPAEDGVSGLLIAMVGLAGFLLIGAFSAILALS